MKSRSSVAKKAGLLGVWALALAALAAQTALAQQPTAAPAANKNAATVFVNGEILTMAGDGKQPQYVSAVAVKDGRVIYAGDRAGALRAAGMGAAIKDLAGRFMMPGFIDSHAHAILYAHGTLNANLRGVKSVAELQQRLREQAKRVPPGGWIEGMGYKASDLKENRHPTKEELDAISTTQGVFAQDSSGHHGTVNSYLLEKIGGRKGVKDPEGGVFYRKPGTDEPDGHIAELILSDMLYLRPRVDKPRVRTALNDSLAVFLSQGYTTIMEMGLGLSGDDFAFLQQAVDEKLLPVDLIGYVKASTVKDAEAAAKETSDKYQLKPRPAGSPPQYLNRARIGGIKFWMDGSLPTALMSQPFTNNPSPAEPPGYKGVQVDRTAAVADAVRNHWKQGNLQIAAHGFGDGAIDIVLNEMDKAYNEQGPTTKRHSIQHASLLRPDQVKLMSKLGVIPGFTAGPLDVMGDTFTYSFGKEREPWLLPANSTSRAGIPWVVNTDFPAGGGPSLLAAMHDMVNRRAQAGRVIAPEERVAPYEGLKAMTINGAIM